MLRTGVNSVAENYEYRQSFGKQRLSSRAANGDGVFSTNSANNIISNSDIILTYNNDVEIGGRDEHTRFRPNPPDIILKAD
jgi:hypothetical protein